MSWPLVAAVAGWVGAVLLLLGYGLVSVRRLDGDRPLFQVLNVTGSTGLGLAAVAGGVWSAAVLNGLWVAIGLGVLLRGAVRRRSRAAAPSGGAADRGPGGGSDAEGALRERRRTA